MYDYLVVGAGLFGSTFAYHARCSGKHVLVVDRRDHIGGNCYTKQISDINVHVYGPHIFHTSDKNLWQFINKFAYFNSYVHRVKAINSGKAYSLPINLMTMNQLWGVTNPDEARSTLARRVQKHDNPTNLRDWALSHVGKELYELLFERHTTK